MNLRLSLNTPIPLGYIGEVIGVMKLGGNTQWSSVQSHMERDCLLANGCPAFVRDRLMEQSDEYRMHFCKVCGLPVVVMKDIPGESIPKPNECEVCQSADIAYIRLPYATKLLMFEFMGMGIVFRVLTDPYEEPTLEKVTTHSDPKITKKLKKVYEPVMEEMTKVIKDKKRSKK